MTKSKAFWDWVYDLKNQFLDSSPTSGSVCFTSWSN